ncbi:MAG: peptide-methionine (S)-S-oxide reductase MsrA [Gallionella sp.]|nr:peptide-methionine (S)-S-oxide reductase MsrA [Gallionella sp.]
MNDNTHTAYLAGGCFWGMEELVRQIPGVLQTEVGYTGGNAADASYQQVKTGRTGHAESLKIIFDPVKLSYRHLLFEFFRMHDPATRNRQGNDIGTQYRSAIFFLNEEQHRTALEVIKTVDASGQLNTNEHTHVPLPRPLPPTGEGDKDALREIDDHIVTEVTPFNEFFRAEEYHQKYLARHQGGYTCHYVRHLDLGESRPTLRVSA